MAEQTQFKKGDRFKCGDAELVILDDTDKEVTNPFSGASAMLCPEAIAVYDYIKGAEYLGSPFAKQLRYFMQKWPAEYMTLLD